jgi:hypothetical protein
MDLFRAGEKLYYFDIDLLEYDKLREAYKSVYLNEDQKITKELGHTPKNEAIIIKNLLSSYKNIQFNFLSINEELNKELSEYDNVTLL